MSVLTVHPSLLSSIVQICLFQGLLQQLVPFHQPHRKVIIYNLQFRFPVPEQLTFQIQRIWMTQDKIWLLRNQSTNTFFMTQKIEFAQSIMQDF